MCDEKGVHWLLCPDTCIKDINVSVKSAYYILHKC